MGAEIRSELDPRVPGYPQRCPYGVYHFRKRFDLGGGPRRFIVRNVSADNRYRLFVVTGKAVCFGPARGDLAHWNFETVDLAPFLMRGENVVAALVWNMGEYAAVGQISEIKPLFCYRGILRVREVLNTGVINVAGAAG